MGYIAPVTQYEYIQYANRTVELESKTDAVRSTPRVFSVQLSQELNGDAAMAGKTLPLSGAFAASLSGSPQKRQVPRQVVEQTASELTGKGFYVNETA